MSRSPLSWILFLISALVGFALFFIPAFIIRPFRYQNPLALTWAMALRVRAPWGTLLCFVVCVALALLLWRSATKWGKTLVTLAMFLVTGAAVMSRLNYFEWMFHPVDTPRFDAESDSKLDKNEMILAVRIGQEARAYPISQMAYHHVLNDVVSGVPIAVTY